MLKKKQKNVGDILEFLSPSGKKGFAQVLKIDDFGILLQIFGGDSLVNKGGIAYVNPESIKHWQKIDGGACNLPDSSIVEGPVFFFGSSATHWTVEAPGGDFYVKGCDATFEQMVGRGYIHKVLWLSKNIEEYLDGKPLVFPIKL